MSKYQLNPLLESEDNDDLSKAQKAGLRVGAYGTALTGAFGIKNNLDKITGIETRYHNAPRIYADQVLDQGILSKHASDPFNLTHAALGDKAKGKEFNGLVYLAKKKQIADTAGRIRGSLGRDSNFGKTLKIKIPYDEYLKMKKVDNPELMGSKNALEYIKKLTSDSFAVEKMREKISELPENQKKYFTKFLQTGKYEDLPLPTKLANMLLYKINYNSVGKGTDTIKGDISPEFIKDSKHFRKNMLRNNFLKYLKKHPGRFAKGVGGAGLSLAALAAAGYLAKKSFESKKKKD